MADECVIAVNECKSNKVRGEESEEKIFLGVDFSLLHGVRSRDDSIRY